MFIFKYFLGQHNNVRNAETILALLQTAACETEEESDVSPKHIL